jgi:hypothetical protein
MRMAEAYRQGAREGNIAIGAISQRNKSEPSGVRLAPRGVRDNV